MDSAASSSPRDCCAICRRAAPEWFLRITVEDAAGLNRVALICPNCAIKLRVSSENLRELQINPWIHEAVASVLRGTELPQEEPPEKPERPPKRRKQ
ncbi:MAG: hypothetical protein ACREQI_01435 [Candidatus Binataceae bacterium]